MPFDGIVTKAVVTELKEQLTDGRITKITQHTETDILLTIRNKRTNYRLLFSIHPTYARFHLTEEKFTNPDVPLMFCTVLRKHLSNAVLEVIEQDGLERVITFKLRAIDEIGDISYKFLVLELMGRHSNLLLLNEDKSKIIDSLKHVSAGQNRYRTILPGFKYVAPPKQDKENPLTVSSEDMIKKLDFNAGKLDRQLVIHFSGLSPFFTKEIIHRSKLGSTTSLKAEFDSLMEQIRSNQFEPTIFISDREDFHVLNLSYLLGERKHFKTANEMLDRFFSGKAERDRVKQRAHDLRRFLTNELKKNERKLKIHEKTLKKAEKADKYQHYGELLTAHMHLVSQGDKSVTVVDYYDPDQNEVTISLKQEKSPSENAQIYFTKYRKLNNSKKMVTKEIHKTNEELNYLNALIQQLEIAREADVEDIREELREQGYLKKQKQGRKRKEKIKPQHFVASDGTDIFVGRNNKQNDYVTHRLAHRNDIWLHTKDIPGSHVVIKSNNPSDETLLEAAQLAAYYSKARGSSAVPVDYTLIKHVNKPSGAKPGFVIYTDEKTLYVDGDKPLKEQSE